MSDAPFIYLGADRVAHHDIAEQREWLVTNGIGGYAMGTVAGLPTRRYHGLLVAALEPPLGRTVLVNQLHAVATYDGQTFSLGVMRWADGTVDPNGCIYHQSFHLEGTAPVWTYALSDALLERRLWMAQGANTTYVQYHLRRGRAPVRLSVKALVNYRDYHALTEAGDWQMQIEPVGDGLVVTAFDEAEPVYLRSAEATARPEHAWYRGVDLRVEAYRGLDHTDDQLHAGTFEVDLAPGEAMTLVASTESDVSVDGDAAWQRRGAYETDLLERADLNDEPLAVQHLLLAADQFVVRRATDGHPDGRSILAGYPWFSDWGRDTMIALPGLTLATGRPDIAATVLRTYARYVDRGMIPNRFPDAGDVPEYNTVDATLWFVEAVRATHAATGDDDLLRDLFPVLQDIVAAHQEGTRYGIRVDPGDGLLTAGEPGLQLTWMDAKVGDRVVTPRIGKPVEINALWYNALRTMTAFAHQVDAPATPYEEAAEQAASSFERFWNAERGCCFDVIDGPNGDDPTLRPNQLLAVSLPHSALPSEQQRGVVEHCARHLLTPVGLRSLSPEHPDYTPRYGGPPDERDAAYHQGTVWSWLIGPFVAAHLRVYDDPEQARSFLTPLLDHLEAHGLGSISEIFDGTPPFTPRGCPAQAWGVAEVLRAWTLTR